MSGSVLVTRPADEAETLAAAVAAKGYAVMIEPLLRIVNRAVAPPPDSYHALAFTSANGVRAFAALSGERAKPAYAVGGTTASALRSAGFADVRDAGGDAEILARLIAQSAGPGARVLHPSGAAVAGDLPGALGRAGITLENLVVYDAVAAERLSDALVQALYACTIGHVLLFSARTAAHFGTLTARAGLAEKMRATTALCLSDAVAREARRIAWRQVGVARTKTSQSLLDLLPAQI